MSTGGKARILVIEDNPADVELLRRALRNAELDCEMTVVDDGADALEFVSRADLTPCRQDLAIIDLNLPKHDGLEILREMRAKSTFAALPVLILSSSPSLRDRTRLEQLGAGRFITKPADLDEFLRIGWIVRELLAEKRT